ncbi:MAG TPA: hypothetical protein VN493_22545 [Thermoanaerobaculia bacterium]|nr:hypothetical protein [Thermoanaerobaculia bacterium]
MADIVIDLTEEALNEPTATSRTPPRTQEDPYGLEPPPGRTLRRLRQDRLAHLFLTGLRVVQKEKEQEQAREQMKTPR